MSIEGNNFQQSLPEIILNGSTANLGTVTATTANLDTVIGNLDDAPGFFTTPTGTVPGESLTEFTQIRKLGQFMYQYVLVPTVSNPCTVTFTVPAGTVVHYTFGGQQYPTARVDNINCFEYSGAITLTNNKGQDGTFIYAVAFKTDTNGKPTANDQSPLLIAKFHITK